MKVAIDAGNAIGKRAARIVLGDSRCDSLVMLNADWIPSDARVRVSTDLSGVDVVISDGTTALFNLFGRSSVAGSPLVVWQDVDSSELGPASIPVVTGANVASTLAPSLSTHPSIEKAPAESVTLAWTSTGVDRKSGIAVAFPEPVGTMWAKRTKEGHLVAPRSDEWTAATAIVEDGDSTRSVGVADLREHLEALILVAVGFVASTGGFDPGVQTTTQALPLILGATRALELDIAIWRSTSSGPPFRGTRNTAPA